jgi:hypothetical protein
MYGSQALYYLTQFKIGSTENNIQEFINRFGALMIYAFIIAASPFKEKTSNKDRIIFDWINHAIPVNQMFQYFFATFTSDSAKDYELDQTMITELYIALKKAYPDIYKSLEKANWIR